ncbi:Tetraspanin-13 isoform X2 [Oopsacas minuta]|uniref:Tetraspanin-13 isoform X2 n=1 Tax=Oopsacas minuta TaxID=111878 RepID=A0AAV7JAN7_9METZ|nr:Tetraspanin-13 isoform X2 [Oopsacas minuta]
MDKERFIQEDIKEEIPSTPSRVQPTKKLTLNVKTVSSKKVFRFGFYFYRNFLISLNVLYLLISVSLLMLTILAKAIMYLNGTPVLGGVAATAAILFLVAIIGLIAVVKQHQITLFFYMITLGFTTGICFALSIACMALPAYGQHALLQDMWFTMGTVGKSSIQITLDCCGFDASNNSRITGYSSCYASDNTGPVCCQDNSTESLPNSPSNDNEQLVLTGDYCPKCKPCYPLWEHAIANALYAAGSIGFIFSLTQILGIYMVYRYRHCRNPEINPYRNFF